MTVALLCSLQVVHRKRKCVCVCLSVSVCVNVYVGCCVFLLLLLSKVRQVKNGRESNGSRAAELQLIGLLQPRPGLETPENACAQRGGSLS